METTTPFRVQAQRAKAAAYELAPLGRAAKDEALGAMAAALRAAEPELLAANALDLAAAEAAGTSGALLDRLRLTGPRIADMADGLTDLADLDDPTGTVLREWRNAAGVEFQQLRVPLGVVGIIYEARPNVTSDATGICLKSGNAVLLRGSSSAERSNTAIVTALRSGLENSQVPADAVQLVLGPREVTTELMNARGLVDVLIPRGGAGLINSVVTGSSVPVIETGTGNCHLVIDATADLTMAETIMINAKTQRPSVCNAIETILVDAAIAPTAVPQLLHTLSVFGVTVHGDEQVRAYDEKVVAATDTDWGSEYLSLDVAMAVVADLDAAIAHVRRWGSGHSETIVTGDPEAAQKFVSAIDAAAVLVNASSRFVDGGQFGFGAEIGISTQKLHARGPMALPELTSSKYVVTGSGQTRA